jgi:hypothetical protein
MCMGNDVNLACIPTSRPRFLHRKPQTFSPADTFAHPLACERRPCTRRGYHEQECRNARLPVARRRWPAADTRRCASAGSTGNMGTVAVGMEGRHSETDDWVRLPCLWPVDNYEFALDYALTVSWTDSHLPAPSVVTPHWSFSAKCD